MEDDTNNIDKAQQENGNVIEDEADQLAEVDEVVEAHEADKSDRTDNADNRGRYKANEEYGMGQDLEDEADRQIEIINRKFVEG